MIRIAKFKIDHLKKFACEDAIPDIYLSMVENDMNPKIDMVSLVNDEGNIVAIAGINHLRIGVGEVWIIRSTIINNHKLEFFKTMRGLVEYIIQFMGLHRVELAVDCRWFEGDKWARTLGFKYEKIAKAYDYQFNDHAIYVRIEKGDS